MGSPEPDESSKSVYVDGVVRVDLGVDNADEGLVIIYEDDASCNVYSVDAGEVTYILSGNVLDKHISVAKGIPIDDGGTHEVLRRTKRAKLRA